MVKFRNIHRPRGALGQILLAERRRRGWTGADLARRAGFTFGRLHAYECSDLAPGQKTMPRILKALRLPEEVAPFLTALARIDMRLMRQAHAVDALRNDLGEAARILIRQGVELAKKAQELRQQKAQEKDTAA